MHDNKNQETGIQLCLDISHQTLTHWPGNIKELEPVREINTKGVWVKHDKAQYSINGNINKAEKGFKPGCKS